MESIELSLGAIVALLILKEVFGFLRSRAPNGNNKNTDDLIKSLTKKIYQTHEIVALKFPR